MDNFNLHDPLPALFIGLSVIVFSFILYEFSCYLRRIVPKSVECWFCKHKTEVNFSLRNSWICPSCEQYNGFSKDGDYNKVISSQYNESLNLLAVAQQIPKNEWRKGSSLCNKCNLKQQLKVQHLASFVPMSEKNYDKEIEHFQEQIEKNYELCGTCEVLVTKVLQNIREELSLPKKLYSAISQVKIRGDRAIYINMLLSLLLAVSSMQGKISLPPEISVYIYGLRKYTSNIMHTKPDLIQVLNYWIQFIIATGFVVNSVGYYQTKSISIFLNSCSWVLMFFLTMYPAQYEDYVTALKVISGVVSITISCVLLMNNSKQRLKQKISVLERRNAKLQTSPMFQSTTSFPTISRSPSNSNLSTTSLKYGHKVFKSHNEEDVINTKINNSFRTSPKTKHSPIDEISSNINFGISNLNLGQRYRKETKQQNIKPLITPPKFNPFSGTKSCCVNSDKNYHWKPSSSFSYQYEPSVTPSVFESYEPQEPSVATITSYGYPQPCYPSCPQTLAYYFSSRNFSKPSVIHSSTPINEKQNNNVNKWTFIYSLPVIFLIGCNIFLLYFVYNKEKASLKP